MSPWPILLLFAATLYCIVRGVFDMIEKRYWWGVAGLATAVMLMMAPFQSHVVTVDLPAENPAR